MRLLSYLAIATCVGVGGFWLSADGTPAVQASTSPAVRTAKLPAIILPPALDVAPLDEAIADEIVEDEAVRGHEAITDPAEFAMVFTVGGTTYLRLAADTDATAHGTPRLVTEGEGEYDMQATVIADVTVDALPPALRGWANRDVLVDGVCKARVTGFAEVSRVEGDPNDPYAYDENGVLPPPEAWTVERVRAMNLTLVATLDHCAGSWARAADWSPAAVVARVEAPALEQAALADLVASQDAELAASWKEQGGEGEWRAHASLTTSAWAHPLTGERWVFVQASHPGGCGEPGLDATSVYRAGADGEPRFVGSLDNASEGISQVVDLDGDGQPEFITGGDDSLSLRDLAGRSHESIDVPRIHYGCGC